MASRRKKQPAYTPTPPMERIGWREEQGHAHYYGRRLRFIVHRVHYMPDKWFVSCVTLGVDMYELLGAHNLEEAKRAGLHYLLQLVREVYPADLESALQALEKKDAQA